MTFSPFALGLSLSLSALLLSNGVLAAAVDDKCNGRQGRYWRRSIDHKYKDNKSYRIGCSVL